MTGEKRKLEPPLKLGMAFGEALSRFVATEPAEVEESVERSKTKKPPETNPRRADGRVKPRNQRGKDR